MEISVAVHKIIKFAIYSTVFFTSDGGVDDVLVVVNRTNHQGCQFDVHFIQCQAFTDISGIVNEFSQYVQNYFQLHVHLTHNW